MLKKIINIIYLNFKGYSLLRAYQIYYCSRLKISGKSIEFGSFENRKRNFSNFFKGDSKFFYSNIYNDKNKDYIKLDLTKKISLKKSSFNNIIIFNVLEHLKDTNMAINELQKILKKDGTLIGSTPFIYQIHGAPNDYYRFTKDFYLEKFKKKFKNLKIIPLGFGPFVASFSLIYPYIKYLPIFKDVILAVSFFLDTFIQLFVKTKLNEIYPIGFIFILKK